MVCMIRMKNCCNALILAVQFRIICCLVTYKFKPPEEPRSDELQSPPYCVIEQEKETLKYPPVPAFLSNPRELKSCRIPTSDGTDSGYFRCKQSNTFILPQCFCGFHHVWEAMYHKISACNDSSDNATQLTCSDCIKFSLGKNGPCINGGQLKCRNRNDLVVTSRCICPNNYRGMFCEHKVEIVSRPCRKIDKQEANKLPNCDETARRCFTQNLEQTMWLECESKPIFNHELRNCSSMTVRPPTTREQSTNKKEPRENIKPSDSPKYTFGNASNRPSLSLILYIVYSFSASTKF